MDRRGGPAECQDVDTARLSVASTWTRAEPFAECMARIEEVIAAGCEPHVQPYMKLNALEKVPHAMHDWTVQRLQDVARWANGWVWKTAPFTQYDRHRKNVAPETYDEQQGLFV